MPRASLEEALTAMKTFKYTIDLSRAAMDQYGVSADKIGDLQYSHNKARWEAKGAPPLPLTASISATPVEAEAEAEDEGDGHVLDSEGHDTVRRLGGKVLHLEDDEQTKKEAANKVGDSTTSSHLPHPTPTYTSSHPFTSPFLPTLKATIEVEKQQKHAPLTTHHPPPTTHKANIEAEKQRKHAANKSAQKKGLESAFAEFDKDGSGQIDLDEFKELYARVLKGELKLPIGGSIFGKSTLKVPLRTTTHHYVHAATSWFIGPRPRGTI